MVASWLDVMECRLAWFSPAAKAATAAMATIPAAAALAVIQALRSILLVQPYRCSLAAWSN